MSNLPAVIDPGVLQTLFKNKETYAKLIDADGEEFVICKFDVLHEREPSMMQRISHARVVDADYMPPAL